MAHMYGNINWITHEMNGATVLSSRDINGVTRHQGMVVRSILVCGNLQQGHQIRSTGQNNVYTFPCKICIMKHLSQKTDQFN